MSAWHKVDADEIWLWHGPAPVTLQLGGTGDSPAGDGTVESIVLGTGIARTARRESPPAMPWCLQGSGNAPFQERATRLSPVWSVPALCSTDSRSNNANPSIMRYHIMRYRVRRFRNINSL